MDNNEQKKESLDDILDSIDSAMAKKNDSAADDTVKEENVTEEEVFEEPVPELVTEEEQDEYGVVDGLTILAKTELSDTSGFYLVNFEQFTSLIGYINDEIFVLKTFDEFVNDKIYVKIAEHLPKKVYRYIVKVGMYKMIIHVTDKNMSHLIDL